MFHPIGRVPPGDRVPEGCAGFLSSLRVIVPGCSVPSSAACAEEAGCLLEGPGGPWLCTALPPCGLSTSGHTHLCSRAAWIDKCRPNLLITESTYATTIRDSKRCRERDFLKKVHETVERGGKVAGGRRVPQVGLAVCLWPCYTGLSADLACGQGQGCCVLGTERGRFAQHWEDRFPRRPFSGGSPTPRDSDPNAGLARVSTMVTLGQAVLGQNVGGCRQSAWGLRPSELLAGLVS